MNCEHIQRYMLLAQTGELTERESRDAEAHASSCADCRAYRAELDQVVLLARRSLPAGEPSAATMRSIRAAAAGRRKVWTLTQPALSVLAYAAVLVLALGAWFVFPRPQNASAGRLSERQARISGVSAILSLAEQEAVRSGEPSRVSDEEALRALAKQLLLMEGLGAEESIDESALSPDAEHPATDLRSSNTPGLPMRECV